MYYLLCFDDFILQPSLDSGYKDMYINRCVNFLSHSVYSKLSEITDLYNVGVEESISIWKRVNDMGYNFFLRGDSFDTDFDDTGKHYYIIDDAFSGRKAELYHFLNGYVLNIKRAQSIDKLL